MTNLARVGFGKWGQQLFRSLQSAESRARFTAIVSNSPDRVATVAGTTGLKIFSSFEDALGAGAIDGFVLATPHSHHAEQVSLVAEAGKHVFVEKPFALTAESAGRALAAVAKAGKVVAVGHNRRFLPAMIQIKRMITNGEIGRVMHIETTYTGNAATKYAAEHWRLAPGESPAGGLAGSGIHMIDAIIHLAGPIANAFAFSSRQAVDTPMDDTTAIVFTLRSGVSASVTNIVATTPTFRIKVFGSAGSVELRGQRQLILSHLDGSEQVQEFPEFDSVHAELVAYADAIEGKAAYPITPAEIQNGVATFEAVCKSVEKRHPIAIGS